MLIGICGKQGSGKSTLSKKLVSVIPNSVVLNIDTISHKVLENKECFLEIINTFGDVTTNKKIDRVKLGNIVFKSPEMMNKLTECTWKYMEKEIDDFIGANYNKTIILEWLLLHNTKYLKQCEIRILLDTDYDIRLSRVLRRDNISKERFDFRDKAALPYEHGEFNFIINEMNESIFQEIIDFYEKSTISGKF